MQVDLILKEKEATWEQRKGMLNSNVGASENFLKGKRNSGKKGLIHSCLQTILEYVSAQLPVDRKNAGCGAGKERVC